MSTYLQSALAMAARGIPVALLPAGQKGSNEKGWQDLCTTSAEEIIKRAEQESQKTNYACVAKAAPEGYLFLDDDGGIRAEYEKVHGLLSPTLKSQSCNGSFHYVFKHSAASLAYQKEIGKAYIGESTEDGSELWSLRMHNAYIVGPGSVVNNKQGVPSEYKIAYDAPIIEIPDTLL